MKWWPFKKKLVETKEKSKPLTITLDSNDTPKERAVKICQAMGLVMNKTTTDMLPAMEQALTFYQKHDRLYP